MRRQVTTGEVLEAHAYGIVGGIYKVMPGIVKAYHPSVAGKSPPTVDVQPAVHDMRIDADDDALAPEPWPILAGVPVGVLQLGAFRVTAALAPGNEVTLLSFDQDPTDFRATGQPAAPLDTRRHGGGHWIALPFALSDVSGTADPGGDLVVHAPASGGSIVLGEGATDAPALASKVDANFSAIVNFLTTLLGPPSLLTYVPTGGGTAPAVYSGGPPPSPEATASALVKTK